MEATLFTFQLFGTPVIVTAWKIIGVFGAVLFASRWLVSAYYSRQAGKPVTPRLFWFMSIFGSLITLGYFVFSPKQDLVGVIQNLLPFCTACYMLYLDFSHEKKVEANAAAAAEDARNRSEPRKAVSARAPVIAPAAVGE
jgi:lipid-A-disaccharide synthase-like uncharacterized protein